MTIDLHPDLEQRLREVFARHAATAPLPTPELPSTPHVAVAKMRRRTASTRTRWLAVGGGAAAALVGVGFVGEWGDRGPGTIQTGDSSVAPIPSVGATTLPPTEPVVLPATAPDVPAPVPPVGTEVPLVPADVPADFTPFGGADTASAVAVAVDGHPTLVRYRSLAFWGGRLQQFACVSSGGGTGCQPDNMAGTPFLTQTSAIDNGEAAFDLLVWANVPDEVAYVVRQSSAGVQWQRPVAGAVAFPVTGPHSDAPLTALDGDGNVVDTFTWASASQRGADRPSMSTTDNLTDEQRNQLIELANATVGHCLAAAGATWDPCFAETAVVVGARFDELGGEVLPLPEPPVDTGAASTVP